MIRDAAAHDAAAMTGLMLASRAYDGEYRAIIRDYPVTPTMIRVGCARIAERDGVVLGFYLLSVREAELDLMFVADAAQGRGIGAALFGDMRAQAAAAGLARVRIVAHPPAAAFYRRVGAVDVGVALPRGTARWARPILELAVAP